MAHFLIECSSLAILARHEHDSSPGKGHIQRRFGCQGADQVSCRFRPGIADAKGRSRGKAPGGRKPACHVCVSDSAGQTAKAQIHPIIQSRVGRAFEGLGRVETGRTSHAACNR